jgi:Ca-activated chloride channel family protein
MILMFTACNKSLQTSRCQSLSGKVIDGESGFPVSGAQVRIENVNIIDTTDQNGEFRFEKLPACTVSVSLTHVDYLTDTIEQVIMLPDSTTELNFELQPANKVSHAIFRHNIGLTESCESAGGSDECESEARPTQSIESFMQIRSAAKCLSSSSISLNNGGSGRNYIAGVYGFSGDFNTEEYGHISENGFKSVTADPLSTFSIDVDAASYSNVRRFINEGRLPPPDAVRIEEMINYFDYDYPAPSDEHPFSISTELSSCPWNQKRLLAHIGLQGRKIPVNELPPGNLVFLIDCSGSMQSSNKLPLLQRSFRLLVNQLRAEDRVAIVVYAGSSGLVLESTPGDKKATILQAIDRLEAGGSTNGGSGIELAYNIAFKHFIRKGNNRVILATDGDFNVGVSSDGELVRMIEKKRDKEIYLTVLGFGCGNYKDSKMEQLADKGNGNYAYIDNMHEARKVLVKELGASLLTLAKDVKIQVEFNPTQVQAYRLVGYENRILQKEDFNDDTKDAGEIGAGHTVTALYEIVPVGVDFDLPNVDSLKYQQVILPSEATKSDELMTVKLRYKSPDSEKSKLLSVVVSNDAVSFANASDNFRFSAAVAEFGMLLRNSEYIGDTTYEDVFAMANSAKGKDDEGYRAEMVRLVKMCGELKD